MPCTSEECDDVHVTFRRIWKCVNNQVKSAFKKSKSKWVMSTMASCILRVRNLSKRRDGFNLKRNLTQEEGERSVKVKIDLIDEGKEEKV